MNSELDDNLERVNRVNFKQRASDVISHLGLVKLSDWVGKVG